MQVTRDPSVEGWLAGLDERLANLERIVLTDTGWTKPTLENSWVTVTEPGYRKQANLIRLRGQLKGGLSGKSVFTLPEGFRPTQQTVLTVGTAGPATGILIVEPSGVCTPSFVSGGKEALYLDGCTFTID